MKQVSRISNIPLTSWHEVIHQNLSHCRDMLEQPSGGLAHKLGHKEINSEMHQLLHLQLLDLMEEREVSQFPLKHLDNGPVLPTCEQTITPQAVSTQFLAPKHALSLGDCTT